MDRLFIWVLASVVGLVFDLAFALLLLFVFSVIGIPFLDALSYWQCFGILIAAGIIYTSASLTDKFDE